jgi:hypothetical protein
MAENKQRFGGEFAAQASGAGATRDGLTAGQIGRKAFSQRDFRLYLASLNL